MKTLWLMVPALVLTLTGVAHADTAPSKMDGVYQIVKATKNKVWRLNTQSGEISVCTLSGDNLICTTSANAADVPKKSYAAIEAERAQAAEAAAQEQQAKRDRELKFLDKILALVRELLQTAMGNNSGS